MNGPGTAPVRAAYLLPRTMRRWSADELWIWAERAAALGLNTVFAKLSLLDTERVRILQAAGLRVFGSFACYSDHDVLVPATVPFARPVDAEGHEFAPMEWYRGIAPTSSAYDEHLIAELTAQLGDRGSARVDGVFLDFLRWPLHWELELREGATPRDSSYDPATVALFAAGLGAQAPSSPVAAADWIGARHPHEWRRFRRDIIVRIAGRLAEVVRSHDAAVGMFLVPGTAAQLQDLVGQDVRRLAEIVDLIAPMTYHAIQHRSPQWPADYARDLPVDPERLLPMIQITAAQEYAGANDWGPSVTAEDLEVAVRGMLDADRPFRGFCLFPGEALGSDERAAVRRALATITSTTKEDK